MTAYWLTYVLLALAILCILAASIIGRNSRRKRSGYRNPNALPRVAPEDLPPMPPVKPSKRRTVQIRPSKEHFTIKRYPPEG